MNQLTKDEYIWAVSVVSKDDGYSGYHSYFTKKDQADKMAQRINGTVVQTQLWLDEFGEYYQINNNYINPIMVDAPEREEILKKLSQKERKVLGL